MENEHHQRQFRGCWIPIEIIDLLQQGELSCQEVMALAIVDSLVTPDSGCYASNEYIGKSLGISGTRTSQIISELIKKGLIIKVSFDGRRRHLETAWSKIDPEKVNNKWLKGKLRERHDRYANEQNDAPQDADFSDTKSDFRNSQPRLSDSESLTIGKRKSYVIEKKIEKCIEKDTLSPAERGDGLTGFPINKRTSTDTDDQNLQYTKSVTKELYDALAKRRKIMRNVNLGKWSSKIKKFLADSPITQSEFDRVLKWYINNIDGKYVPRAYSAATFCEKFVSIKDAYERNQMSDEELQDRERRGIPSKPVKCTIRNLDGTKTVKYARYED